MLLVMLCEAQLMGDSPNQEVTRGGHHCTLLSSLLQAAWLTPALWAAYKASYSLSRPVGWPWRRTGPRKQICVCSSEQARRFTLCLLSSQKTIKRIPSRLLAGSSTGHRSES